jgi:hypothetical protein
MFLLNDKPISPDTAFTHEGISYPNNWIRLASPAERAAIGITEVADPVRADDRFYWSGDINNPKALEDREESDQDGNPLYVKVLGEVNGEPAMVDTAERLVTKGLKSVMIAQVKHTAGTLLAQTDWMVIRKAERDVALPPKVAQQRQHVVGEADRLEKAIAQTTTVEQLIAVVGSQQWGE